jgi:2-polyprenyl-3-methyl-5-hydroxy-6-metoxy-1,4-benzoquinol methylase
MLFAQFYEDRMTSNRNRQFTGIEASSNFRKHTSGNPVQRRLIGRFHARAAGMLADLQVRRVLDAGCGEGFGMRSVLAAHPNAIGMDQQIEALQVARHISPSNIFSVGDLLALPFQDSEFDLVICLEVLEHIEQPERALSELCRVSNRWLLLSVPHEPLFRGANFLRGKNMHDWGNDPGHVNHWSARGFAQFVARQCRIVDQRQSFPWTLALCQKK